MDLNEFYKEIKGLGVLSFPFLEQFDDLAHCYTTRKGGVSSGCYESLNLSFNRNDSNENVMENFRRLSYVLGIPPEQMVLSDQIHEASVYIADKTDAGKGLIRESDIKGIDALVTGDRKVALVTFYADCVPLYFYDNKKNVIGLSHSGWRSTIKNIAGETVQRMKSGFGCLSEDIIVQVGPHIGSCCFEVGSDVVELFTERYPWSELFADSISNDKWLLDLDPVIEKCLKDEGIPEGNISFCRICTRCHRDILFSHRGSGGHSGINAAVLMML